MITKAQALFLFLFFNTQINNVLLLNNICIEPSSKMEDILPNVWTNLAWRNVHLKELNIQTKADFHRNLISISTRNNINLKISVLAKDKGLSNDNSKLTLISRCEIDFYGFEHFLRIRKPMTTMIAVSGKFLEENFLNFVKEIKMPTAFYLLDIERQVIPTLTST